MSDARKAKAENLISQGRLLLQKGDQYGMSDSLYRESGLWVNAYGVFMNGGDGELLDKDYPDTVDSLNAVFDAVSAMRTGHDPRTGGLFQRAFESMDSPGLGRELFSQTEKVGTGLDEFFTGTSGAHSDPDKKSGLRELLEKLGTTGLIVLGLAAVFLLSRSK